MEHEGLLLWSQETATGPSPILNQMNPVHTLTACFLNLFHII
jgi:hypothetical protein